MRKTGFYNVSYLSHLVVQAYILAASQDSYSSFMHATNASMLLGTAYTVKHSIDTCYPLLFSVYVAIHRYHVYDVVESTCLSWRRNHLNSNPGQTITCALSRACARACICKSIRWFDDSGTRSNGARKVRRKFSDIGKTFAVTKPNVLGAFGGRAVPTAPTRRACLPKW